MAHPKTHFGPSGLPRLLAAMRWRYRLALLALLAGIAIPAFLVWRRERDNRRQELIAEAWRRFDRSAAQSDLPAAETSLRQLSELTRNDPTVTARIDSLHRGEADAEDATLARLLVNEHLRNERWREANREAVKIIAAAPGDMLARGILARQALRAGRIGEARDHLAAIPSPRDAPDAASPGALLLVVNLKRELGDDDSDLLSFIASRLAPLVKSRQAHRLPPAARLQLVQCYHLACDALDRYPELAALWAPAARLILEVGNDAGGPLAAAVVRQRHLGVIDRLRKLHRLSEAAATKLSAEFEREVRDAWASAHAADERQPLPYAGLALACRRAGQADEAARWLDRGLAACADAHELYFMAFQLLKDTDPASGVAFLQRGLDRFPGDSAIQQSLAELAAAAGRPDLALATCRSARARTTDLAWACRLEAVLCLELGRPTQALEALAPIKATLPRDANAMESLVRAACAVGVEASAEEILTPAPRDVLESNGHAGAARGYLASGRINDADRVAARIIERFPDHVAARLIHAEALALRAEAGDSAHWDAKLVQQAIEAFDWLRRRDPANCHVAQRIAWLQLEGLGAAELALQSTAPLRQEPATAHLTPEMCETLGSVLLANGQAEAAIPLLTRAIDAAPTRPDSYIGRASAFRRLGKSRDARADLDRAAALPCSPRQDFARRRILRQIQGDS